MTTLHEENPSSNHPISSLVFVDKLETTPEVMEDKVSEKLMKDWSYSKI
jgi:hypothetical protein